MPINSQEARVPYLWAMSGVPQQKQDTPESYREVTNCHRGPQKFQKKTMFYVTIPSENHIEYQLVLPNDARVVY